MNPMKHAGSKGTSALEADAIPCVEDEAIVITAFFWNALVILTKTVDITTGDGWAFDSVH